jgi:hypothetical protein
VTASSQPLLEEAAAITALSAKLQPMMQRAQQLQADWDTPLACGAARGVTGGADARRGGRGGAAAGVGGVEQHVRQMMTESGTSLSALSALNASLVGGAK